jgi:hypothetical protein
MAGLFSKVISGAKTAGAFSTRTTADVFSGTARNMMNVAGIAAVARDHWAMTTAAVVGGSLIFGYSGRAAQSVPAGPSTQGQVPGSSGASNYNLGASGDLVFALNRLR